MWQCNQYFNWVRCSQTFKERTKENCVSAMNLSGITLLIVLMATGGHWCSGCADDAIQTIAIDATDRQLESIMMVNDPTTRTFVGYLRTFKIHVQEGVIKQTSDKPFIEIDTRLVPLVLETGSVRPPSRIKEGDLVRVRAYTVKGELYVRGWQDVTVEKSVAVEYASRPVYMRALWINIKMCGEGADGGKIRGQMMRVRKTFDRCSNQQYNFDIASSMLFDVNVPCIQECDPRMEDIRQHALQVIRENGVNPDEYGYHVFVWPRWVSERCFAGQSLICDTSFTCRTEIAQPWDDDLGTILHEIGHSIGLHHASSRQGSCARAHAPPEAQCGEGEYGDQSTPMGLNWAAHCYNLPHQHHLGWTTPVTLREEELGYQKVLSFELWPLTFSKDAGLRIEVPGFHAVYVDYLKKKHARWRLQPWLNHQVCVYSYDWDGQSWNVGYWESKFTVFEGCTAGKSLVTSSTMGNVPNLVITRTHVVYGDGYATVSICRWVTTPEECPNYVS